MDDHVAMTWCVCARGKQGLDLRAIQILCASMNEALQCKVLGLVQGSQSVH